MPDEPKNPEEADPTDPEGRSKGAPGEKVPGVTGVVLAGGKSTRFG